MNSVTDARKLADYIKRLDLHPHFAVKVSSPSYNHIGALYTNIILQAGLNYKSVVEPRVTRVLTKYPKAETVNGFIELIEHEGLENIINWKHEEKLSRLQDLLNFSRANGINTCAELAAFLAKEDNQSKFLEIKGLGFKTLDYTLKLLSFDTVAVDRHIYSFLEQAGLARVDYKSTKRLVEYAADLLQVSRSSMDYSIWRYMSTRNNNHESTQLVIDF